MDTKEIPTLEDLDRAVEHQTRTPSDLDRITVAESMAYDLGRLADQLTDHFVQAARIRRALLGRDRQTARNEQTGSTAALRRSRSRRDAHCLPDAGHGPPDPGDPQRAAAVRKTLKRVKEALALPALQRPAPGWWSSALRPKPASLKRRHIGRRTSSALDSCRSARRPRGQGACSFRIEPPAAVGWDSVSSRDRHRPSNGHVPFNKQAKWRSSSRCGSRFA